MNRLLYIFLPLLLVWGTLTALGGNKTYDNDESTMALYEYFYMEGEKQNFLGNFDAAFALMSEATRINPNGLAAQFSLAKMYLMINDIDTATIMLKYVADSDTTNFWYNIGYANTVAHTQQFDEAERILLRTIRNHRNHPELYNSLASVYGHKQEYRKALACYDSLEIYMGNSPELVGNRIGMYDLLGDTATAIAMAEELVENNADNIYYTLYLSDVYRHYRYKEKMLPLLQKVKNSNPHEPLVYEQFALYHLLMGDTVAFYNEYDELLLNENIACEIKHNMLKSFADEATPFTSDSVIIDYYRKLVELYPYEHIPRESYALLLLYTQRLDEACEQLRVLAEQTENSGLVWEQIMGIYIELDKYPEAIDAGIHAIESGQRTCGTYLLLSNSLILEEQYDRAEDYLRTAIDSVCTVTNTQEKSIMYGMLGDIYAQKEMLAECYQYYDSALVYNANNTMVLNNYAYFLACNDGDLLKAETMSSKTLNLEPDNITFIDTYAWILFKMNSYSLARIYMERAIANLSADAEGSAEFYEHYGDILIMLGEKSAAVEQWNKALEKSPDREVLKKKIEQEQYIAE
ncbi:MAG: hypothetical protein IJE18_04190 [Bacteroidaceae bacterium]|nr:hypothetical protein [Bacteroidaceae bacterium]